MAENTFLQRLKKLKVDLKPMTWAQRLDHIWTYYKETLIITIAMLIVVIGVGSTVFAPKKELLMGGMYINTYLSGEGESYLVSEYFEYLQGNPKKQEIQQYFRSFGEFGASVEDYDSFNSVIAMLYAEKVDYLLLNESSVGPFAGYEALLDLRKVFTQEELTQFGDKVRYGQHSDSAGNPQGEMIPIAVEITDLPFIQDCESYNNKVFLAFSASAPNQDSLRGFWEYLLAWESKNKA